MLELSDIPIAAIVLTQNDRVAGTSPSAARLLGKNHIGEPLARWVRSPADLASALTSTNDLGIASVAGVQLTDDAGGGWHDAYAKDLEDGTRLLILAPADRAMAERERRHRLEDALQDAERERTRMGELQRELSASGRSSKIIGSAAPILAMLEQVRRVAPSPATVLIQGESGSGKELVAHAIHDQSTRREKAFIAVNCAAMPETLIESELFGHERGAFTGADRQRAGKFELADTGTLFLDEVAELSPQAQAKLLRVLQEGAFERVGGTETIHVDVRLIAATHRELSRRVSSGLFREDLFYRLNVFRIDVPPLRDRMEDLRQLVEHFHNKHALRMAREVLPISERSFRRMLSYRWPGNVRELENAVERATLLASGGELEIELPAGPAPDGAQSSAHQADTSSVPRDVLLDLSIEQLQRLQIMHALETCDYRVFGDNAAAHKLGINPRTLISRMRKLGIPSPSVLKRSFGDNA